jgi:hypothetical protein
MLRRRTIKIKREEEIEVTITKREEGDTRDDKTIKMIRVVTGESKERGKL